MSAHDLAAKPPFVLVRTRTGIVDPIAVYAGSVSEQNPRHAALLQTDVDAVGATGRSVLVMRPSRVREVHAGDHADVAALLRAGAPGDVVVRDEAGQLVDAATVGFCGGMIALLAHECVSRFDRVATVATDADEAGEPDAVLMTCDDVIVFDHATEHTYLVVRAGERESRESLIQRLDELERVCEDATTANGDDSYVAPAVDELTAAEIESSARVSAAEFVRRVREVKRHIACGDVIQTVISRAFDMPCAARPDELYRTLATIEPAPYRYLLRLGDVHVIGASPERLVRVRDGQVTTHPIAGTRPRGATHEHDARLADELLADAKELSEHMMLVDLGRNDLARTCIAGTTRVSQLARVERHARVMHIVSHVTGQLRPELHPVDALAACFPAGTLTGAPKLRAIELISQIEDERRGAYGGAVVSLSADQCLDSAIIIRTIVLANGVARIRAGAGIVDQSDAEAELAETRHKAAAALRAVRSREVQPCLS